MKQKIVLACIAVCLAGCGREMEVSFKNSVGDRELAEEQVSTAIDDAGDYSYDMSWSEGRLSVKLPSDNDLSREQVEALAESVESWLMPEADMRPVLEIEITETDEDALEVLGIEHGAHYSIPLVWESANADVYYSENVQDYGGSIGENRSRRFMCVIRVSTAEPPPPLVVSLSLLGFEIPFPIGHKKSISHFDQDFFDQTRIETGGRHVDIIVGDMGSRSVNQTERQLEFVQGTSRPAGASRSACQKMIAEKVTGDLNGLLPNRAAKYNVSSITAR
ncbi:hypothetical protein IEI94_18170 [Halomonas sp. ML-15]|uniref:hypothetical protein n=1 Tax=Halomonas sp. ML-15 TaxID=2773305 RepID=UPI001746C1F2|nr:hypothetical protein [Halomonas sp. ML-15]MBD3897786.1 hypothetical protein [Halomonas sp. ML-15]